MLVNVLPAWDGSAESLNRPVLYERFIQNIITREMTRLLPAVRQKYSREERFTFASSLALAMLNSGELITIRNSDIPNHIVEPFVRRGETFDIAKRDLVTNCFLERKSPDFLTFGHKSFGEFLAARRLLDLAKENGLDAEVKRSSVEVWQFFNELVSGDVLEAIYERPDRNANSITLILGTEILSKMELNIMLSVSSVALGILTSEKYEQFGEYVEGEFTSNRIISSAFSKENIIAKWTAVSFENRVEFRNRIDILRSVLSAEEWLSSDSLGRFTGRIRPTRHSMVSKILRITSEIKSWYSR